MGKGNEGDSEESGLMREERLRREMKETVRKVDYSCCLVRCREKASMIARVEGEVGWRRLWDELLSFNLRHMVGLQVLSRLMSHHGRGSKPCPFCEEDSLASELNHILARHGAEMGLVGACNRDWVMEHLKELDINFLAKFCNIFHTI